MLKKGKLSERMVVVLPNHKLLEEKQAAHVETCWPSHSKCNQLSQKDTQATCLLRRKLKKIRYATQTIYLVLMLSESSVMVY